MKTLRFWSILSSLILLVACSTSGTKVDNPQFDFLDQLGITVTDELVLPDSLTLPDIYCGDKKQTIDALKGLGLSHDQYASLVLPAGEGFADEMSSWLLLGVRDMGGGITLAAFYGGNGAGYCVNLMTYDNKGQLLDAINARELHLLWRVNLADASNDSVFTLDGYFTFGGDRVTLHRTMGRCVMDFKGDLKSEPQWQQSWEQEYVINAKGHFVLQGQRVVEEHGPVDHYAALDFKSWDMLVCSLHDTDIMNTWNQYSELVNSTYDPDYKYNPFPWDVVQLYRMNPQRFLNWIAAPQNRGNRLISYFKLRPDDRPALQQQISRMEDAGSRQWLNNLVDSWDNQPLTKHL